MDRCGHECDQKLTELSLLYCLLSCMCVCVCMCVYVGVLCVHARVCLLCVSMHKLGNVVVLRPSMQQKSPLGNDGCGLSPD
jgi:hypothetical protein